MNLPIEINQTEYESLKRSVSGFYFKFNQNVLRYHMNKIFYYEGLLETAKSFNNFKEYYYHHTNEKSELIERHVELMLEEANRKGLNPTEDLVRACLIVRLGNIYNGMFTENKIIEAFKNISDWIICTRTDKEIDMHYKVDAVIEIKGIDKFAIQIKPISFLSYDKGSELKNHKRYEKEFNTKVFYCFYKDKNTIVLNNSEVKLSNPNDISNLIEKILLTL
jgi:hypothetical protein